MLRVIKQIILGIKLGLRIRSSNSIKDIYGSCTFFIKYNLGLAVEGVDFSTLYDGECKLRR